MKINYKLKDYRFCDDCPCHNDNPEYGDSCNLGYWVDSEALRTWNKKTDEISEWDPGRYSYSISRKYKEVYLRPQKCIKERGK